MSPSVSVRLLLSQSDARLVAFARAGHERAFEALVRRYRRPLHDYCRRLLLSDERAEDALQQALLQAWLALRAGTEVDDVRPWLYRIVHNAAVNALRVSGYDYCKLSETLSGADAPQEDLDRRIAVREALAGLAALPRMQREALLRTAVEGRTHQQVARDLGLSEDALRGLVYRARATLRAAAGALTPSPLVSWALGATRATPVVERFAELGAGGGSAGFAGLLTKGGAVAVTASMLAGGIVAAHHHPKAAKRTATRVASPPIDSTATVASTRSAPWTAPAGAPAQTDHGGRSERPPRATRFTRPPDPRGHRLAPTPSPAPTAGDVFGGSPRYAGPDGGDTHPSSSKDGNRATGGGSATQRPDTHDSGGGDRHDNQGADPTATGGEPREDTNSGSTGEHDGEGSGGEATGGETATNGRPGWFHDSQTNPDSSGSRGTGESPKNEQPEPEEAGKHD